MHNINFTYAKNYMCKFVTHFNIFFILHLKTHIKATFKYKKNYHARNFAYNI